jgi:hypothetical protein
MTEEDRPLAPEEIQGREIALKEAQAEREREAARLQQTKFELDAEIQRREMALKEAQTERERETVRLEERKFDLEADIQRREMALKETESTSTRKGLTTAQASIAGAIIALLSGVAGAAITAWSSKSIESEKSLISLRIEELKARGSLDLEKSKQQATEALERKKFETQLILDAIKTPSRTDAIRNLKFFVAAGFVSDPDGKILSLQDESLPSISAPSQESSSRALRATGVIHSLMKVGEFQCTGVALTPHHVITASFCIGGQDEKAVPRSVQFEVGGKTYTLQVVKHQQQSTLALLQVQSADPLDPFLDWTRVREPVPGERIYFALAGYQQKSIELRQCEVTSNPAGSKDFEHNCSTGPGSAGAVIIAVKDDALLGIHHSATNAGGNEIGVAAKLSTAISTLRASLNPLDAQLR